MGGHSLGGVVAASYAEAHPDRVAGLVLWAPYPADGTDLSVRSLRAGVMARRAQACPRAQVGVSQSLKPAGSRVMRAQRIRLRLAGMPPRTRAAEGHAPVARVHDGDGARATAAPSQCFLVVRPRSFIFEASASA
ncbi:MAG: alpha/beta fold hydrolase [Candidatus Sericytochromatia bacterium]|nr:alpha/beta fold hydrolase [Candidatus Tanganyikabacteria bacterium]